ncbi:8-oxo-dGTP diphosphatase [Bradyrhizobium sp. AZCC 2230]
MPELLRDNTGRNNVVVAGRSIQPRLMQIGIESRDMAKSSKLVVAKRGRVLLVRRRRDRLWMFPGGRKRAGETERKCLRREIREELPKLKLGPVKLWREVKAKNRRSGRKMSDAIFLAKKASGPLKIGDKKEIDRAVWCKPRGIRLTPTSRYIRDKLFPK